MLYIEEFDIRLNFEFSDLHFGVEAIKMFAITEGEYKGNATSISSEPIINQLVKYLNGEKYILDD